MVLAAGNEGRAEELAYPASPVPSSTNLYSPWGILTTDVRGPWGYSATPRSDPPDDDAGEEMQNLYTIFGGTSAASSLTAGLIALLLQAGVIGQDIGRKKLKEVLAKYYPHVA